MENVRGVSLLWWPYLNLLVRQITEIYPENPQHSTSFVYLVLGNPVKKKKTKKNYLLHIITIMAYIPTKFQMYAL